MRCELSDDGAGWEVVFADADGDYGDDKGEDGGADADPEGGGEAGRQGMVIDGAAGLGQCGLAELTGSTAAFYESYTANDLQVIAGFLAPLSSRKLMPES